MVEVNRGDDADVVALVSELLGDGLILHGHGLVHVDGAGVGLVAGGDGGCGGSGVRAERGGIVGDCRTRYREVHKAQRNVSVEDVVVVGVSHCTQIVGRCLELRIAHTVADEQKYIFWFFTVGSGAGRKVAVALRGAGHGSVRRSGINTAEQHCGRKGCSQYLGNYLLCFHGYTLLQIICIARAFISY